MNKKTMQALLARHLAAPGRRAQTAIALATSLYLYQRLEQLAPKVLGDFGSGFSSVVLRTWAKGKEVTVITTDHREPWLRSTMNVLRKEGLSTKGCMMHETLFHEPPPFDFIFLDLGPTALRVEEAPRVVRLLAPDGLLVLDDWHMPHYRRRMVPVMRKLGYELRPIPQSKDRFGRYVAEADQLD
jgi:predicted O-methyltransferase YrrM